jgi:hypothetical protein
MDKFVSNLTDYGGSFSATCPTMEEVCQLLLRQWSKFVSYLTDNGKVCQLLDRLWRKFVSYLSDNGGSLSVT